MSDSNKPVRHHEIRLGMSVYWVRTVPSEDGEVDWFADGAALSGTAASHYRAALAARAALGQYDAERQVVR